MSHNNNNNVIKIFDKNGIAFSFHKLKDVYRADVSDVRSIELPVVYTCSTFRKFCPSFKRSRNVYIIIKYIPGSYNGSIIISNSETKSVIFTHNNEFFSTCESEALKKINDIEDRDDAVFVEMLIVYDTDRLKCVFGSIPAKGWPSNILSFIDNSKKYIGWFMLTILGQLFVATMGYWFKGEPWYFLSLLQNAVKNSVDDAGVKNENNE